MSGNVSRGDFPTPGSPVLSLDQQVALNTTAIAAVQRFRGAFAAGPYVAGDMVLQGGILYAAIAAFTATSSFNPGNWIPLTTAPAGAKIPATPATVAAPYQPYTGYVARGFLGVGNVSANKYINSRSAHIARGAISNLIVSFPNFFMSGFVETNTGGAMTATASVEYPAGTFNQLKFAGAASGSKSSGQNLLTSDSLTIAIPDGATFWIRCFANFANGAPNLPGKRNDAAGEAFQVSSTSISDLTMGGTITSNDGTGSIYGPLVVQGTTTRPSFLILGDSRQYGTGDTPDASCNQGELERALGAMYGTVNCGNAGDRAYTFVASNGSRRALATTYGATHVLTTFGINDIRPDIARSLTTLQADLVTIWNYFSNRRVYHCTFAPFCTDSAGTTPGATEAVRVAANTWLRDGAPLSAPAGIALQAGAAGGLRAGQPGHPLSGVFEIADLVESARNSGTWKTGLTGDGIHETQAAYAMVGASGAVYPAIP